MTTYAIAQWGVTYEVDDHGHAWAPGRPIRSGPLAYVRVPMAGTHTRRRAMVRRLAGGDALAAEAVYLRLVEHVAGMDADGRADGVIRDLSGQPATLDTLPDLVDVDRDDLRRALALLTDPRVGLLVAADDEPGQSRDDPQSPPDSRAVPGTPGLSRDVTGDPGIPPPVKSSQINQTKKSQVSTPDRDAPAPPDSTSTIHTGGEIDSTWRQEYRRSLATILRARTPADLSGIGSAELWLWGRSRHGADRTVYTRARTIAQDCVRAETPMAAWYARMDQELGYVAASARRAM